MNTFSESGVPWSSFVIGPGADVHRPRAIRAGFDLMMKIMTAFIVVIEIVFRYCSGG